MSSSIGSRATIEPIPGLAEAKPLTHIEALELDHIPKHLLVLGGGYVGRNSRKPSGPFRRRVTLIDRNSRLAHTRRRYLAGIGRNVRDEGITVVNERQNKPRQGQTPARGSGSSARATEPTFPGRHAPDGGRGTHANTSGIGLEKGGSADDRPGHVKVNERCRPPAEGVWAVGDCAGSRISRTSQKMISMVVSDNIAGGNRVTTGRQVPFCMFTDPERPSASWGERGTRAACTRPHQSAPSPWRRDGAYAVAAMTTLPETRVGSHEAKDGGHRLACGSSVWYVNAAALPSALAVSLKPDAGELRSVKHAERNLASGRHAIAAGDVVAHDHEIIL